MRITLDLSSKKVAARKEQKLRESCLAMIGSGNEASGDTLTFSEKNVSVDPLKK